MEKKGDLRGFEHSVVVSARQAGGSISETADRLEFTSLGFTENSLNKRKYPVRGSCVDKNALLMSEESGQKGNSNSNNHSFQPRCAEYHL